VLYVLVLITVSITAFQFRRWALAAYGTEAARQQWEVWRSDVQTAQGRPAPVQRRVPRSAEPPALVLMRDHFGSCLVIALTLTSALFGTAMVLVRGSLNAPRAPVDNHSS
jgi:hypothetical protein